MNDKPFGTMILLAMTLVLLPTFRPRSVVAQKVFTYTNKCFDLRLMRTTVSVKAAETRAMELAENGGDTYKFHDASGAHLGYLWQRVSVAPFGSSST